MDNQPDGRADGQWMTYGQIAATRGDFEGLGLAPCPVASGKNQWSLPRPYAAHASYESSSASRMGIALSGTGLSK